MVLLVVLLVCSMLGQVAMLLAIDYQKRCIEDLKTRQKCCKTSLITSLNK